MPRRHRWRLPARPRLSCARSLVCGPRPAGLHAEFAREPLRATGQQACCMHVCVLCVVHAPQNSSASSLTQRGGAVLGSEARADPFAVKDSPSPGPKYAPRNTTARRRPAPGFTTSGRSSVLDAAPSFAYDSDSG